MRDIFLAIAKNSKYYACQSVLALVVCKLIENSATYTGREINFDLVFENQQLAQQLHKAIIKKLKHVNYTHPLETISEVLI